MAPTPNAHLEEWMKKWMEERYKGGLERPDEEFATWLERRQELGYIHCKDANQAIVMIDYLIGEVNQMLQQGRYCSKAGAGFHSAIRAATTAFDAAQHIARKDKKDAELSNPAPDAAPSKPAPADDAGSGPYWENDAHRFSPFD